jgi:vacuolar-type H+-ATPase subunit E/Vma4
LLGLVHCWHEFTADLRRAIMAETTKKTTKSTKTPAARTGAPAKKSTTAARSAAQRKAAVDRTAQMSDDVLKSVESGQRAAIEAVRKFVDTVDEALPALGGHPSRREAIIDAALEMADKLVTTQYEFLRSVVRSADRTLTKTPAPKK